MRYQGKISDWKDEKGFGFIMPNGGGKQVFVHIKSFANRQRRPIGSEIVTYELLIDKQGRAHAENVAYVGDAVRTRSSSSHRIFSLWLAIVFLGLIGVFVAVGKLSFPILWLYLTGSAVAFLAYWIDKSAARNDQWRIAEKTLHFFSLIGGWPGALVAQRVLHHKSSKTSFQIAFWTTVILNCSALAWLLTATSANALRVFLGMVYPG